MQEPLVCRDPHPIGHSQRLCGGQHWGTGDAWMLQTKTWSICKGREEDYNNCFAPVVCCWLYIKRKKKIKYHLSFSGELTSQVLKELSFLHLLFAWLYKYNTCLRKEQQCSFQPCRISIHSKFIWHLSWLAVNLSEAGERGGERAGAKKISTKQKMFVSLPGCTLKPAQSVKYWNTK